MGGLVWFILYQGNFLVPNTVNSGASIGLVDGLLINIGLIMLWGVQHSVMARPRFKALLTEVIPSTAERSTYTLASELCLIAIVFYWQGNNDQVWSFASLDLSLRILSLAG